MANMILTRELFRHNCEEQEKLDTHLQEERRQRGDHGTEEGLEIELTENVRSY